MESGAFLRLLAGRFFLQSLHSGNYLTEELVRLYLQGIAQRKNGVHCRPFLALFYLKKVFSLYRRKVRKRRLAHPSLLAKGFEHIRNGFGQVWILSHMVKVSNTVDLI